MQSAFADVTALGLPGRVIDGVGVELQAMEISALEHLAWAVREQRVTDGYRRLLQAIMDDSWVSNDD